jgi:hypothetical protein
MVANGLCIVSTMKVLGFFKTQTAIALVLGVQIQPLGVHFAKTFRSTKENDLRHIGCLR